MKKIDIKAIAAKIKNFKFKVIMVLFFTGVWSYHLTCLNSFQNQLELIKFITQVFTNLSLIIVILFYEKTHKIFNDQTENNFMRKFKKTKTLVKGNKVLFKFLNSLNSGILLYDKNMDLIFFNRKMKRYVHNKNSDNKSKFCNSSEYCNSEEEKHAKNSVRQNLLQLKNIKCFIPEETSVNQNQVKIDKFLKK